MERQLIDFYNDIYGLADLENGGPLDIVSVNDKEGLYEFSIRYRTLQTFRRYKLNEKYGLSVNDYLALPFHTARSIIEIEKEHLLNEKKIADTAQAKAEKELRATGLLDK